MQIIFRAAVYASSDLAEKRGNFPGYSEKIWDSEIIQRSFTDDEILKLKEKNKLRNCSLISIAPTGSIGTMLNISTGCEPFFALSYTRKTVSLNKEDTFYTVDIKAVEDYKRITGNTELPSYFVTSEEIPYESRINMQAVLQEFTDTAISSTVNLPSDTTVDQIKDLYIKAWKAGLKGVTIYVTGSRDPILSTDSKKESEEKPEVEISQEVNLNTDNAKLQLDNPHELERGEIIKAGNECIGLKRTLITGCGSLHCTAYFDPFNGELRECYLSKGSTGGCNNFMISLSRMISLAARGGIKIENILDQLKSCGVCPSYAVRSATKKDTSKGSCCPVAVGEALKSMAAEMQDIVCKCNHPEKPSVIEQNSEIISKKPLSYDESKEKRNAQSTTAVECPNCHEISLVHLGGCTQCTSCGYSKCN
jgi:ribonucleoside-diphosphate reductase alpha chain